MYQTMTQIGKTYGVDAKAVGKILYTLKIRDPDHPEQRGFPFEQAVVHGIAKAYTGRTGEPYYRYDIERVKEEFEAELKRLPPEHQTLPSQKTMAGDVSGNGTIEAKLQEMLTALNSVLQTGEIDGLHRLKGDIADIYGILARMYDERQMKNSSART
ncbi:hypothetical protein [Sulfurimonas diazotrophicus]|uniref:Uncharacterized protein n=1 Tax=Sulfurimonas diazotrophicus TaxID=3131939 RepID=A0ABZ3HAV2_9BACT